MFAGVKPDEIDKIFAKSVKFFAKSVKFWTKYLHLDYPDDFDGDPLGEPQFPRRLMSRDWIGAPAPWLTDRREHGEDTRSG